MSRQTSTFTTTGSISQLGRVVEPIFTIWQYRDDFIPFKVYWDNSRAFPVTVASASATYLNATPFTSGEMPFDPVSYSHGSLTNVPIVGSSARQYLKAQASAANGLVEIPVVWDLTRARYVVTVLRSTGVATAGSCVAESSSGNSIAKPYTLSATTGSLTRVIVDSQNAALYTGSPVLSGITKVRVIITTSGQNLEIAETYSVSDLLQVIGSKYDMRFECYSSFSAERNLEVSEQKCRQITKDVFSNGDGFKITLNVKQTTFTQMAIVMGTMVGRKTVPVVIEYNSDSIGFVIGGSNTMTLPINQSICSIRIGDTTYFQTPEFTNVVSGEYYDYNATTGVLTFPAGLIGRVPQITLWDLQSLDGFDHIGNKLGYVGHLWLPRFTKNNSVKYVIVPDARLSDVKESPADDGDEYALTFTSRPGSDGKLATYAYSA
jgi:hypothetical protein